LEPAAHHLLAVGLVLATVGTFYLVLRELRFAKRDAAPIALMALFFPWATAVRLWPTGSVNNVAVLLLFVGLLVALRGLRVGGRRGFAMHLVAAGCYAASILTYDATTVVALMLWPSYVWLHGWRRALPRAALDICAAGAAAVYTAATTVKGTVAFSEQLSHGLVILREGAHLLGATLVPVASPGEFPAILTVVVLGTVLAMFAAVVITARRASGRETSSSSALRWGGVAAVALAALALCWAIYVPGASFTPTLPGVHDRVNILALYPAVVFVYAVLRASACLISRNGYAVAIAASIAIVAGYVVHDFRQERDWARASDLQNVVLESIERASPPDGYLVLAFGYPAEVASGIPIFNVSWDLYPAARLRTAEAITTYPVFRGSQLECSADGVTMRRLATPLYRTIDPTAWGNPRRYGYPRVMFVDVASGRRAVIRSPGHCVAALNDFTPGPFLRPSS
jgi:hypothetical protein